MVDVAATLRTPYRGGMIQLAAILLLSGCGGPGLTWSAFHDQAGGFSAEFPGKVEKPPGSEVMGPSGVTQGHFFCSAANSMGYDVTYILQSNSPEFIAKELEKLMNQKLSSDSEFTDLTTDPVKLGKLRGVEQVYTKVKGGLTAFKRVCIFHTPTGSYYVSVESRKTAEAFSPDVNRFFDSFKIDRAK